MNILSERVITFRKEKGLTQEQLANAIGVSRPVLALIENGTRTPSKEIAKKLSSYFNVPLDTFLVEDLSNFTTISPETMVDILYTIHEFLAENHLTMSQDQEKQLLKSFYEKDCRDPEVIKQTLSALQAVGSDMFTKGK